MGPLASLLSDRSLSRLEILRLELSPTVVPTAALVGVPALDSLVALDGVHLDAALGAWLPRLSSLQTLHLMLGPGGLAPLAGSRLPRVRELHLHGPLPDADQLEHIFPRLGELVVSGASGLGPDGLRAILPSLERCETLDLSGNPLGPDGATLLAASELPALRVLRLRGCAIGVAGAEALAASPMHAHLRELDLDLGSTDEALVPDGVRALCATAHASVRTQLERWLPQEARRRSGFFARLFGRA